ncbi:MAG: hypothetical protein ACRDI1_08210 [Actinomycetota bacterium]
MERFEEIEVRRIRVVDDQGTTRMVFTAPPIPDGTFHGKPIAKQNRPQAGLIYYNEEGTECGGLVFGGTPSKRPGAGAILTFDQYDQDQVIGISQNRWRDKDTYGIAMMERPLVSLPELVKRLRGWRKFTLLVKRKELRELREAHAQRVFLGRRMDGEVGLNLMDSKGRRRIRVGVDAKDAPYMEFLGESGEVIRRHPPD